MNSLKAPLGALLVVLMGSVGCSGGPARAPFIPDVQLNCSSGQVADCSSSALPVFVGLVPSIQGQCDDFLGASVNSTQRRASFVASGTAVSARSGIYLTSTISSWVNSTGGAIDSLDAGTYTVCAFIDTNGNDRVDTNEPVGQGSLTVGSTGLVLSDWTPAFN